ncbi:MULTISPECIES: hypothetical protein [Sorangium]|uniref:hypothetical protein n=1 Tax=Sorangium TaxID=39643 RepID=UPI003D9C0998
MSALSSLPGCGGKVSMPGDDAAGAAGGFPETGPGTGRPSDPPQHWVKSFGSPSSDDEGEIAGTEHLADLAVNRAGNIVLGGGFAGTFDLGAGPITNVSSVYSGFVATLDHDGNGLWSRVFGSLIGATSIREVATNAAGDVFVVATFTGSVDFGVGLHTASDRSHDWVVIKLDQRGHPVWSRAFGLGFDGAAHLAVDDAGNVILGGTLSGTVDLGTGPVTPPGNFPSPYVLKLDPTGKTIWAHTLTEDIFGEVFSVAASPRGDIAVAGWFSGSYDFGCGPLAGTTASSDAGSFVASLDEDGGCRWNVMTELTQGEVGSELGIDDRGNVIVTGMFFGTTLYGAATAGVAPFVAKFDQAGALRWSNLPVSGLAADPPPTLAVDVAGNVSVAIRYGEHIGPPPLPSTPPTAPGGRDGTEAGEDQTVAGARRAGQGRRSRRAPARASLTRLSTRAATAAGWADHHGRDRKRSPPRWPSNSLRDRASTIVSVNTRARASPPPRPGRRGRRPSRKPRAPSPGTACQRASVPACQRASVPACQRASVPARGFQKRMLVYA